MNFPKSKNANIHLYSYLIEMKEIDPDDSYYRFIVGEQCVKYVRTAPGALSGDEVDWAFAPVLLSELLPHFPPGYWNEGYVTKSQTGGEVAFVSTEIVPLPAVQRLWHPELDFSLVKTLRQRVRLATHPEFNEGKPVFIKLAVWPWEIPFMEIETTIYESLDGHGIAPRFLGHLTEGKDGRVIGFVTDWVDDARHAGPGDLEDCRKVLRRLHELGIKHGNTNKKFNFLVREGRDVVLIDFENAERCPPLGLEEEMNALEGCLADTGYWGGIAPPELIGLK